MQKRENPSAPTLRADQSKYVRAREASEEGKSKAREKKLFQGKTSGAFSPPPRSLTPPNVGKHQEGQK